MHSHFLVCAWYLNSILTNNKNYKFLNCDWLKKILFSTNSPCQVVIGQFVIGQFVIGQFIEPITFKVVVKINQSQPFRATLNNLHLLCQSFNANFPFLS